MSPDIPERQLIGHFCINIFALNNGELVKTISEDEVTYAMVESISNMAKALKISCVAEHIENVQLLKIVQSMGIECAQGYFFSKPMPLDETINASDADNATTAI